MCLRTLWAFIYPTNVGRLSPLLINCFNRFCPLYKQKIEATGFIPQINQWVFALRFYKKGRRKKLLNERILIKEMRGAGFEPAKALSQ